MQQQPPPQAPQLPSVSQHPSPPQLQPQQQQQAAVPSSHHHPHGHPRIPPIPSTCPHLNNFYDAPFFFHSQAAASSAAQSLPPPVLTAPLADLHSLFAYLHHLSLQHRRLRCQYPHCNRYSGRLHACIGCMFIGCFSSRHIHLHSQQCRHWCCVDVERGGIYCFAESDSRILTSRGLLFLEQIETLQRAGEQLLFGCYEERSKRLLYSKGRLVFPAPPQELLEFTSDGKDARWTEGTGDYGTEGMPDDKLRSHHVSLRVTPGHDMYVQLGSAGAGGAVAWTSTRGRRDPATGRRPLAVPEPHRKVQAQNLLSDDDTAHVRLLACAHAGYAPQATSQHRAVQRDLHLDDTQFAAFIELLGFWLGGDSLDCKPAVIGSAAGYVTFSQVRQTDLSWLRNMLMKAGLKEDEQWLTGSSGTETTLHIMEPAWLAFFHKQFGDEHLHLPDWMLQELPAAEMRLLISGLHRADGAGERNAIFTSSARFRDQLVQALLHCGYSACAGLMYREGAIRGYNFHDQSIDKTVYSISDFAALSAAEQRDYRPIQATADAWKVSWTELDHVHTTAASNCWPSMSRQQCIKRVRYDRARDGRTWCVAVEHADHLIIAQRAQRGPDGVTVVKQSRPIVVGNCFHCQDYVYHKEIMQLQEAAKLETLRKRRRREESLLPEYDRQLLHSLSMPHGEDDLLLGLRGIHNLGNTCLSMSQQILTDRGFMGWQQVLEAVGQTRFEQEAISLVSSSSVLTRLLCLPSSPGPQPASLRVATLNPVTQQLEFLPPAALLYNVGEQQMVSVRCEETGVSFEVTVDHELYTAPLHGSGAAAQPFSRVRADALLQSAHGKGGWRFLSRAAAGAVAGADSAKLAALLPGLQLEADERRRAFFFVFGWWLVRGDFDTTAGECWLALGETDKMEAVLRLREAVALLACDRTEAEQERMRESVGWLSVRGEGGRVLADWAAAECQPEVCGQRSPVVPERLLQTMTAADARTLLDGLRLAGGIAGAMRITVLSPALRDNVLHIALMAGFTAASRAGSTSDSWTVEYSDDSSCSMPAVQQGCVSSSATKRSWCVNVPPHHLILVRERPSASASACSVSRPVWLGNCFVSVILQVLVHNPLLRNYFLSDLHNQQRCRNRRSVAELKDGGGAGGAAAAKASVCLACDVDDVFAAFYSGDHSPFGPQRILLSMWTYAEHLAGYAQQDAHELYMSLLDGLHHYTRSAEQQHLQQQQQAAASAAPLCNCVVHTIYGGQLRSDVQCSTCQTVSTAIDPMFDISVDLSALSHSLPAAASSSSSPTPVASLVDCLRRFTTAEKLWKHDQLLCRRCGQYCEATKQLSLHSLPLLLSVHFKRFERSSNAKQSSKIDSFISFPLSGLDLAPYLHTSLPTPLSPSIKSAQQGGHDATLAAGPAAGRGRGAGGSCLYDLLSVVVHRGSLETGHYLCYFRHGQQWYRNDDKSIVRVSEQEVSQCNAYLLFYIVDRL